MYETHRSHVLLIGASCLPASRLESWAASNNGRLPGAVRLTGVDDASRTVKVRLRAGRLPEDCEARATLLCRIQEEVGGAVLGLARHYTSVDQQNGSLQQDAFRVCTTILHR